MVDIAADLVSVTVFAYIEIAEAAAVIDIVAMD